MQSVNPHDGSVVADYEALGPAGIEDGIARAHKAFEAWKHTSRAARAAVLNRVGDLLEERAGELAVLAAREMGKPVREGRAEAVKCAWVCRYYAEHAETFLADEDIVTEAARSFVTYEPLGPVLAVMPWNFPFWQVFRFAAPALAAGNTALLKHASNVGGCALVIEKIFTDAGLPAGVFQTLLVGSDAVAGIIADPRIVAVTLTGSTPAGRAVAAAAGMALKKCVLELGGSDPYLILQDADLDTAVTACVTSRLLNSGQSCIAAKRFVVHQARISAFEERMAEAMSRVVVGDPLEEETGVGPLARHDLREELHRQVRQSLERGARLLLGGTMPDGPGAYYPPTVLTGVEPGMPAFDEELFGPVAAIVKAENDEAAVVLANATEFGLGAAVFTRDRQRGEAIAARSLEAGACFVNDFVKSDPRLPFGGIKTSGFGRELGRFGIREFVNIKTVWVA